MSYWVYWRNVWNWAGERHRCTICFLKVCLAQGNLPCFDLRQLIRLNGWSRIRVLWKVATIWRLSQHWPLGDRLQGLELAVPLWTVDSTHVKPALHKCGKAPAGQPVCIHGHLRQNWYCQPFADIRPGWAVWCRHETATSLVHKIDLQQWAQVADPFVLAQDAAVR